MWPDLHQHRRKTDEERGHEKENRQKVGERREQRGNHDTHDSRNRDDHDCRNERWRRDEQSTAEKVASNIFTVGKLCCASCVRSDSEMLIQAYDDILNILALLSINIYGYSKHKALFRFKSKKYFKGLLTANTADK